MIAKKIVLQLLLFASQSVSGSSYSGCVAMLGSRDPARILKACGKAEEEEDKEANKTIATNSSSSNNSLCVANSTCSETLLLCTAGGVTVSQCDLISSGCKDALAHMGPCRSTMTYDLKRCFKNENSTVMLDFVRCSN